jgi:hypothetical protein
MTGKFHLFAGVAAVAIALSLAGATVPAHAQQSGTAAAVKTSEHDIGGVVTGAHGPEAGVWVIAETSDLPTRYIKIVVTDDKGRYVLPDLPDANYQVWVRGYGLVDSPKLHGVPGRNMNIAAVAAPSAADAAHYYPAIYWFSMLKIPDKSLFGGSSAIPPKVTQQEWLTDIKNRACVGCHQQGQEATRTLPAAFSHFKDSEEAWVRRVQSGQSAPLMINPLAGDLGGVPFKYFADWTDAIAKGALPPEKPPRPQGLERNVVITMWGWGSASTYLHDAMSTDKRHPTVNAYGKVFGSPEYATDNIPMLDPKTNTVTEFKAPVRDPDMPESLGEGRRGSCRDRKAAAAFGVLGR